MHQLRDQRYRILAWLTLGIALTGTQFAGSAWAAAVLYSNGPILGTDGSGAPTISTQEVVDSFVISSASTITGTANVGLWIDHLNVPSTVNWAIRTAPFSGVLAGGTASWSASFLFTNQFNFDIYSGSFSIPDLPVAAGTYYLALSGAVTVPAGSTYWDRDNGPSQVFDGSTANSNAFQIIGNVGPASAPEPATIALMALSLAALAKFRRYL
jgi:hypothetical protein